MRPRYRIRIGDAVLYVTTKQQCVDAIEQLEAVMAQMGNGLNIQPPKVVGGYISRVEFYNFINQLAPGKNTRQSAGSLIFAHMVRATLSADLKLDMRCSTCGQNIAQNCTRTHKGHSVDLSERYSFSMASFKENARQLSRIRGMKPEFCQMVLELLKFA